MMQHNVMIDQKQLNITFSIKEIKTLKFEIINIANDYQLIKENLQFQIHPLTFMDYEKKILGFDIIISVFLDKEKQNKICELITRISYKVLNLYDLIPPDDKFSSKIPENFMHTLLSIALSTSRGILSAKTEGSLLNGIYLPIINPSVFKPIPVEKNII